ncbi:MAG: Gfo/Idh/MocA family oxidoreductase [Verrucomicrobia bacterium]|nr:Gfo/Idh/MocA family oxidoreductase [Verrucomicrobiota bacterium]
MNSRRSATSPSVTRRQFLRHAGASVGLLATCPLIVPSSVLGANGQLPPSQKINLAAIGVAGMGAADLEALAPGCNIVALCDADFRYAEGTFKKYPNAKRFQDFRKMLDEVEKSVDAVLVATPDHTHAVAAMAAIRRGKHVYCEKPLAHSVREVRELMKAASAEGVITQLGNQGHSFGSIRHFCEWIWAGAIGRVHTIHCGAAAVNSALDQLPRLKEQHAVPDTLNWDVWLGPAPYRPYHPAYLPAAWRGWVPFGNGTVGDWVCHVVDPVFWALDLAAPKTIVAEVTDWDPKTQGDAFPKGDHITFEFPAKGSRGPVTLHWYSGTWPIPRPPEFTADDKDIGYGAAVLGDKGTIVYGSHGAGGVRLVPQSRMDEFQRPPQTIPRAKEHHADWLDAIRNHRPAGSDFSYGGPLTEIAMLGVIALKFPGQKLEWDAAQMRFTNNSEANQFVAPPARPGWEI